MGGIALLDLDVLHPCKVCCVEGEGEEGKVKVGVGVRVRGVRKAVGSVILCEIIGGY